MPSDLAAARFTTPFDSQLDMYFYLQIESIMHRYELRLLAKKRRIECRVFWRPDFAMRRREFEEALRPVDCCHTAFADQKNLTHARHLQFNVDHICKNSDKGLLLKATICGYIIDQELQAARKRGILEVDKRGISAKERGKQ